MIEVQGKKKLLMQAANKSFEDAVMDYKNNTVTRVIEQNLGTRKEIPNE